MVVRHAKYQRHAMDIVLGWARKNAPDAIRDFSFHDLSDRLPKTNDCRLCVFWLQDPIQNWCLSSYQRAVQLEEWCVDRGIVMVNRPSRLANAGKAEGARRMAAAGVRTPHMLRIASHDELQSAFEHLPSPIFLREDWGHGGPVTFLGSQEQLNQVDLTRWKRPVAVEWVDASNSDGLFRKYRYVISGERGMPHHLQISAEWLTRGTGRVENSAAEREEIEYLTRPDANSELLHSAARKLGLEFVAFDYGYDQSGKPVVWEANPFPYIHFSRRKSRLKYRNFAMHATLHAILLSYYDLAQIEAPQQLTECVEPCLPRDWSAWKRPYYRTREWCGAQRRRFVHR